VERKACRRRGETQSWSALVASRGEARDRRRIGGIFLRDEERIEYTAGWTGSGSV
jgi:hypothetical protein